VCCERFWRFVIRITSASVGVALFVGTLVASPAFGQGELLRRVRTKIDPNYPELARRMNLRGTVKILVVVSPDGNLKDSKVLGGNPILVNAAMDALKKWKFEPSAEESTGTVEFRFLPPD
jgi:TonB family protein